MSIDHISADEARRIALAAQGFARARPLERVGLADVRRVILQLGLVQLDYVNVLAPAHYQVLFSRLGQYDRQLLHELIYQRREFIEHWAHEASIVPVESWPLLRYRRETHRVRPYGFEGFIAQNPEYVNWVLEQVRQRGPLTADKLPHPEGASRWLEQSWFGSVPRAVLESHFGRGLVAIADRRPDFSRAYDLAERVIPVEHHGRTVERAEAQRELLRAAAKACGVAAAADLADYYRMPLGEARPRIEELLSAGELRAARIEGWRETAYVAREARVPGRVDACALLSPFDPLAWYRPRLSRVFQFDHRFEIFVPEEKRKWGCYVLPFLMGDRLVGRVDLKADRIGRRLLVRAAYVEPGAEPGMVAEALAGELRTMAAWLGLESVKVGRKGNLARRLPTVHS